MGWKLLPKLIILKYEPAGKDFRNKINACFALEILLSFIDPLLSKRKINSHLAVSRSTGKSP
jgi:hypothetical protein